MRFQSNASTPTRAAMAAPELMTITSRDVPTATVIGQRMTRTRTGTARKPPPTPNSPVMRPTAKPPATIIAACTSVDRDGVDGARVVHCSITATWLCPASEAAAGGAVPEPACVGRVVLPSGSSFVVRT